MADATRRCEAGNVLVRAGGQAVKSRWAASRVSWSLGFEERSTFGSQQKLEYCSKSSNIAATHISQQ